MKISGIIIVILVISALAYGVHPGRLGNEDAFTSAEQSSLKPVQRDDPERVSLLWGLSMFLYSIRHL